MSGIYIHIPFCKQACHYCDFHFSTSLKNKQRVVDAICKELVLRKSELKGKIKTIYFGGGTPSLLSEEELSKIFKTIAENFIVSKEAEITLEANPDDLSEEKLLQLSKSTINRLSIGVQSFFEEDLKLMNRAHNAGEAWESIQLSKQYFSNISIDLIYGIPKMTNQRWLQNLEKAFELNVPHLSCYALTVEPKTALKAFIEKGIVPPVEDGVAQDHHHLLVSETEKRGFVNYEFSNFGKPSFESQNNLAYWQGKPYLGVGPSAHSYDGKNRSWNVANNSKYIKAIEAETLPLERETLTKNDRYNEYVMTRLRTMWGIQLEEVEKLFGKKYLEYLLMQTQLHIKNDFLIRENDRLMVTKKGKFLSDGIASDLFLLNLD
ncbi:radical SAM family heme chaperone HemW [Aureisphaera sp. CAU 1614]|uniref:Heme chaperone HemW n=1 Tax=Halomarinibacterium sedimenti TaxID=2857106 RepID=A0A9X1JZ65_9FLAO|nr:radical SAM family heme chaperone HemW [Halomarinibacterium sedimenti]MBW2936946.1 radical SAM family heme chaperone HemW [Halomarinibacterium sedimenti]